MRFTVTSIINGNFNYTTIMVSKIYNKKTNFIVTLLSLIILLIFTYKIINSHNDLRRMLLLISIPFLILSIVVFSYKKFVAYATPEETKLIHRPAMLATVGLVFVNYQIVFNDILEGKIILITVFLVNIFNLFILYLKAFSTKANRYNVFVSLTEHKKQLNNASMIIAICIVLNALFVYMNGSDIQHVILSVFFVTPFLIIRYLDKLKVKKKLHYIILLIFLILMLAFVLLVSFTNNIASLTFSFYFLISLITLLSSIISLKLTNLKTE